MKESTTLIALTHELICFVPLPETGASHIDWDRSLQLNPADRSTTCQPTVQKLQDKLRLLIQ